MKRILLFAIVVMFFTMLGFAQAPLPTLVGYENLSDKGVALSDTAQEGSSFKFWMSTTIDTGKRDARWDMPLGKTVSFPKGAKITVSVMIPEGLGSTQISLVLLNDSVPIMNSALNVVSENSGPGIVFHRQDFQFPEIDTSFNKIRVNLSYLQNQSGSRIIFFDGIYLINGTTETIIDDCNGGSSVTKPGVTTLTAPANGAVNVSITPTFTYNPAINTTQYQLQVLKKDGIVVYDQKNAAASATLTTPLAYNAQYDWRVKCWNGATPSDNWSTTSTFTTAQQIVTVPIFASPVSGGKYQDSVVVNWSGGDAELQLMDMSGVTIQNPFPVSSPYTFTGIASGDYQFRGRFINPLGDWSSTVIFTIESSIVIPDAPSLIFPLNDATGLSIDPVLQWSAISIVGVKYELLLGTSSNLVNPLYEIKMNSLQIHISGLSLSTTYYWRVRATLNNSVGPWSNIQNFMTTGVTGVGDNSSTPKEFSLSQNYPNPFNPTTLIQFSLPASSPVKISVYDITGRKVSKLIDEEFSQGTHSVSFDGTELSSGMYIYTVCSKFGMLSRKMLLMK